MEQVSPNCLDYCVKVTHSIKKWSCLVTPVLASTGASHPLWPCSLLQLLPEYGTALRKRRQGRKSMSQRLRRVFHKSCPCCPRANPQSPAWLQRVIVHNYNSVTKLSIFIRRFRSKIFHNRSLNNSNIPLPALLCASPSPLALCASPPTSTLSLPICLEQPLLSGTLLLMPLSPVR